MQGLEETVSSLTNEQLVLAIKSSKSNSLVLATQLAELKRRAKVNVPLKALIEYYEKQSQQELDTTLNYIIAQAEQAIAELKKNEAAQLPP